MNCGYYCVCKHNCSSHNGSRAHAANKRAWRWSRERFAKDTFFSRRWRFPETGILINCHIYINNTHLFETNKQCIIVCTHELHQWLHCRWELGSNVPEPWQVEKRSTQQVKCRWLRKLGYSRVRRRLQDPCPDWVRRLHTDLNGRPAAPVSFGLPLGVGMFHPWCERMYTKLRMLPDRYRPTAPPLSCAPQRLGPAIMSRPSSFFRGTSFFSNISPIMFHAICCCFCPHAVAMPHPTEHLFFPRISSPFSFFAFLGSPLFSTNQAYKFFGPEEQPGDGGAASAGRGGQGGRGLQEARMAWSAGPKKKYMRGGLARRHSPNFHLGGLPLLFSLFFYRGGFKCF